MAEITKPIMLDETGQDIVTKLQNIANALGYNLQSRVSAIEAKEDRWDAKAEKVGVNSQTAADPIQPNAITLLGTLPDNVTITLAQGEVGKAAVYDIIFTTGSTVPTITWPASITWMGGNAPTINANKTYEVSISEYLATIVEF